MLVKPTIGTFGSYLKQAALDSEYTGDVQEPIVYISDYQLSHEQKEDLENQSQCHSESYRKAFRHLLQIHPWIHLLFFPITR